MPSSGAGRTASIPSGVVNLGGGFVVKPIAKDEQRSFLIKSNKNIMDEKEKNLSRREQIEQEEKIRAEVRAKAEKEIQWQKRSKDTKKACLIVAGIFIFFIITILALSNGESGTVSDATSSTIDLNASVSFTGEQFVITNANDFDWTNVELEINSVGLKSGYIYKPRMTMVAAGVYTVGVLQFAKKDGTKFNPFTTKPLNFSIWCDTPKGKGFYYAIWQ